MNEGKNKDHAAIRKILKTHPDIDMEPLFEWDTEEGKKSKGFTYIAWFERAEEAAADGEVREGYNIDQRKLSTIYQFALAMPLLLEGIRTWQ